MYLTLPDEMQAALKLSADQYAKQQTAGVEEYAKQLLNTYNNTAKSRQDALALSKQNAINEINNQRDAITQEANNNAKQAYINKMLSQKDLKQALSQAGINTSSKVGTAYTSVNNAYNSALAGINQNRANSMRNIDNQVNSANLQYAQQEAQLLADIEAKRLDLQKYGNELAYSRYQDAIKNYSTYKELERAVNASNLAEAEFEEQKRQQAFQNEMTMKQYNLALEQAQQNAQKIAAAQAAQEAARNFSNTSTATQTIPVTPQQAYSTAVANTMNKNIAKNGNPLNGIGIRDAYNFNKVMGLMK